MVCINLRNTSRFIRTLLQAGMLMVLANTFACQPDKGKDIPDVSHINIDMEIRRFERDLFALDTLQFASELAALEESYPAFGEIFFGQLLGSTDPRIAPEGHEAYVRGFVTDSSLQILYDTVQDVYPDMAELEEEFARAFRYFQYYFPEAPVPTVTSFISEFSIANFIYGDTDLAVGLEFFLGSTYPYRAYNPGNSNFSNYLTRSFNRDHLVSKTLFPLCEDMVGPVPENRLIDFMIHNGKKRYLLEKLLPHAPDTVIMEYSGPQMQWCRDNEWEVWAYLLDEELLYSTNRQDFRKLVEYSPTGTSQMPPESPGRAGNYIGKRIIEAYMERYPETSLSELIALTDSQKILDASRYRPPR